MHVRPKLIALVVLMSALVGSACSFFLWSLEVVTRVRFDHPWLLWLLPVAGVVVARLYQRHGGTSDGGNNLILDRIHDPGGGVPRRMAPLVLFGTLVTHLFGGSAGREGTAVQMGGSLASAVARYFQLDAEQLPALLMAGVAAGFGAVFGTPLAGAVFAVEVVVIGKPKLRALPICLLAAYAGDWTCRAWGVSHECYHIEEIAGSLTAGIPNLGILGKVLLAAVAFGLAGWLFATLAHRLSAGLKRWIPNSIWRPAAGGAAIIVLFLIVGRADYLGLGAWSPDPQAVTLTSLFESAEIHSWAWAWKLIFTAITVASGFKGGEVTPLFFIGAALGNALAGVLGAPPELFAGLGMVAIFAGASNTPVACTLMGIELFGIHFALPIALACGVAFLCSGHAGIYRSQRFTLKKPFWRRPV
jgi:H+/Cl- antiporter ClcA